MRLKDKVAVVTGAGRGIGRGIALLLAQEGAKVVVNDLGGRSDGTGSSAAPSDEVVQEIKKRGGVAVPSHDSVTSIEGGERIIKTALDNFGRLDILVNNAGILRDRMVFNMTEEEWDAVMKVHLYGHFHCIKFACILFRQQRSGRIINMSSEAGLGSMGQANYSAAKEGIVGLTRTVARDMGRYGVTCNAIYPRARTRLTDSPELQQALERKAAAGVAAPMDPGQRTFERREPEDIAPFVAFLATDAAANINGYVFLVVGGKVSLLSVPQEIKTIYKRGPWTVDELVELVPQTLGQGLVNPSPPQGR
mgnify:CR=1 FL=1